MNPKKKIWKKVLSSGILAGLIIFLFAYFIQENNVRIVSQNARYIEDVTLQTSQRIDEVLDSAQAGINTISTLYGQTLEKPEVNFDELKKLTEKYPFDYIEYVNKDGVDFNGEGRTTNVSDREYYKEGMKGNSGMDVIFDSRIDDENLVVFYAPLYFKGEIIGVLTGHYRESQMQEILETTFFGEKARTFLCVRDGRVIACSMQGDQPENIYENFQVSKGLEQSVFEQFDQSFKTGKSYGFIYAGSSGTGNAYMTTLPKSGWTLVQTFPSAATKSMQENANAAGIMLEVGLIVVFLLYMLFLIWENWKQRAGLLKEKQEMSYIVDGIIQLFDRFVMVDLKNDTYKYLGGTSPQSVWIPMQGTYPELIDYIVSMIVGEDERKRMNLNLQKEQIQEDMSGEMADLRYEYPINRGNEIWEELNIICLEREGNVPASVLFTRQDVSKVKEEEMRAHAVLKEAYEMAENANRAKSDFLSRMSHDIRTPMNAIMGMTAIASMHIDDKERLKDCLNKIKVSSRHLLGLINEVLDMSKIESGKVNLVEEEFGVARVTEALLAIFHSQIEEKKQNLRVLNTNIVHEEVVGDAMRLQQVLVNIMGNAVKFTPEGGSILVSVSEKPSYINGSGCYEFVIEDTGIGMEKEFVEHIFEPFTRAHDSRIGKIEGTGLGMAIAKNIVQMMNGDIKVESKIGEGSRFTVTVHLKLHEEGNEDIAELKGLPVLVADDDSIACESACELLNSMGMKADWVISGDEAVDKLVKAHDSGSDYAAVILDWKMPGKDGVETAKEIRERIGKSIPIIILSAFDWADIEHEARDAGVDAFISKPLFKSRLVHAMKYVATQDGEEEISDVDQLTQKDYSGKRILLVEDNEINMEIAEELITSMGASVDKTMNGKEAVDKLHEMPAGYYDLVLMDIQMPVMNGYEATEAIRASEREDLKKIPIVAMSADAFAEDARHAKQVGMNDHIAKPVEIVKLMKAFEDWITFT